MSRSRSSADGPADEPVLDLFGDAAGSTPQKQRPSRRAAGRPRTGSAPAGQPTDSTTVPARPSRKAPEAPVTDEFHVSGAGIQDIPGSSARSAVTIATLTSTVRDVLEGTFMPLWVRGEVSDFKRHRNGHWYFTLRDQSSQIRCVVWARDQRSIPAPPDDGMQLSALGQLTVYAARGDLQFTVRAMEAAGDGLWRKALDLARQALERDGLLAADRKRRLPRFPRRIAVITSPSGAALHDVVAVARRRWAAVELVVVPTRVQGEGAPEEIRAAIEMVGRWGDMDLVIVGRGGGAREDLWAFNDEQVARALAACPVPTISAVGHEVDFTLCDLVADLRAPTPSAAAEAAVPVHADVVARVGILAAQLRSGAAAMVQRAEDDTALLASSLRERMNWLLERRQAGIHSLAGRLDALSPLATLGRGYAIAVDASGATLPSARSFTVGHAFSLHLRDGRVDAVPSSIEMGATLADVAPSTTVSTSRGEGDVPMSTGHDPGGA